MKPPHIQPKPVLLEKFEHTPVGWRYTVSVHCGKDRDDDTAETIVRRSMVAMQNVIDAMRRTLEELEHEQQAGGDV